MVNPMSQIGEITSFTETFGVVWFVLQLVVALGVLYFISWKFIIKPAGFKDQVEVWDKTGGKLLIRRDRGRWVENKVDKTGEYRLLKDKTARLKQPRMDWALINRKGKYKYTYIKTGESGFDYAQLEPRFDEKALPKVMALSDEDWAKHSLKKAMEKKTMSGFWNENKGSIIFVTMAVLTLVLIYWTIGFATETATSIANSARPQADRLGEIAEALQNVANQLSGGSSVNPGGETPPPGV